MLCDKVQEDPVSPCTSGEARVDPAARSDLYRDLYFDLITFFLVFGSYKRKDVVLFHFTEDLSLRMKLSFT